ncbi:MAG: 1-acyl-sn-glycerol-3-phosphate acyltransferase [Rhodobacteraceae bacterium]|nr:1-acyl-sn-glycerol-3-phosphate acyltransferase [Paracoccaceae bacterium]
MSGANASGSPEPLEETQGAAPARLGDPGWNEATWNGADPEAAPPKSLLSATGGVLRLLLFVAVTLVLLPPFFAARALGGRRDRAIAALWCGAGLSLCGLRTVQKGDPMRSGGALLANHASWIDILVIGWLAPVHFVAKAEVSGWPLFGWIGRISNTVFIERRRTEAKAQERQLAERARDGDLLCIFPEGTSSDGLRVLPFKSSLFSMFFAHEVDGSAPVAAQPVTVDYRPNVGLPRSFYGWWGRMALFTHLWDVVCLSRGGEVVVTFHTPLDLGIHGDRKSLAAAAQRDVAAGLADSTPDRG